MKDEMDILKEVGTISAGQGSIALSEILGRKINLKVPNLDVVSSEVAMKKLREDQIVVCVFSQILTGLEGKVLFLLDEKSAFKLVDMCYKVNQDDKKNSMFTEMGISLIKEVGNVVISSFAGALSMILKTLIIPSIPTLVNGPVQQILKMAVSSGNEYILFIETIFEEPEQKITGGFYLVLDPKTVQFIQDSCKKLLESLDKKA
ncbi:MAG: chemotaxis protein CheC [Candidatus Omnitrophica bacterium]|nr:chemotaxis protein CheC [Candidatus Omnitrophota bacterium]